MNQLNSYIELIGKELEKYNPSFDNLQKSIYESVNYSLSAGGKRLRPVLMLEIARLCGGDIKNIMPYACAIEMIHTYSLIHDDLPAMDNDELRRGKPTNHVVFGEATAILAGDALLTNAFKIMSQSQLPDKTNQLRAIAYMAEAAGTEGMIGGQIVDLENEGKSVDINTLQYMHKLKTGALIKASCVVGGLISGASNDTISILEEYAVNLGMAFQIRDDILDVKGNQSELGKPIGSDEKSNKCTYVSLLGIEESEKLCYEYTNNAITCLKKLKGDTSFLIEFTQNLAIRNK